jgi:outer membrane protein OmpA-like peptidoglycan-associated protein
LLSVAVAKKAFVACAAGGLLNLLVVDLVLGPRVLASSAPAALVQQTANTGDGGANDSLPAVVPSIVRGHEQRVVARFDSQQVESIVETELKKLAAEMIMDRTVDVILEGHSDPLGDSEYNKSLSLERAIWARNRLVAFGVSPSRIQAVGLGASRTVESEDDSVSSNRRVEARFVPHGSIRIEEPKPVVRSDPTTARIEDAGPARIEQTEQDGATTAIAVDAQAAVVEPQPAPVKPDAAPTGDDPWSP